MNIQLPDTWTHDKIYTHRYQTPNQIAEVIDELRLAEAGNLLDMGCGNGAFAIAASQRFPDCQIIAIDPLPSAVEECQKRVMQAKLQNIFIQKSSIECIPLKDNCVDRLLMRNVIHHLDNIELALKEACRVLSPNGRILLEAPCNIGSIPLAQLLSDIYFKMDASHRRTFHTPKFISSVLDIYEVKHQSQKIWQRSSIMSSQVVSLIHQSHMADQLNLQNNEDGKWIIKLNFMRILAQKICP
ncbi:MAG: methyltransferase domain-containing protein [Cyanobacteria bacterium P01_F01_bin.150]